MDPLVATLVLIALALLGARLSFRVDSVPLGPRLLLGTGVHFLLLGVLLGPMALGLLGDAQLEGLFPFFAVGLGWVGFLFGIQLHAADLSRFPAGWHVFALGQALVVFAAVRLGGDAVLGVTGVDDPAAHALVAAAAAIAAVSAPAAIALVTSNFFVRGRVAELLLFTASLDALVGLGALQWVYATQLPAGHVPGLGNLTPLHWAAVTVALGVLGGLLFIWLRRLSTAEDERALFLLGIAAFVAGAALRLGVSPLLACTVAGITVAHLARERTELVEALRRWEKPIYVVLLLLAGALVRLPSIWVVPAAAGLLVLRAAGKTAGAALLGRAVVRIATPKRVGLALVPQGGMALAMAISALLTFWSVEAAGIDAAEFLFATVVLSVVGSELAGPFLITAVLRRADEIAPQVEEAIAQGDTARAVGEALRHVPDPVGGDGGGERSSGEGSPEEGARSAAAALAGDSVGTERPEAPPPDGPPGDAADDTDRG